MTTATTRTGRQSQTVDSETLRRLAHELAARSGRGDSVMSPLPLWRLALAAALAPPLWAA